MAEGELVRARRALESGERTAGRAHAEHALLLARDAADLPTMGEALALLGDLDGDLVRLEQAAAAFEVVKDAEGAAWAHLRLADLLLDGGFAERARQHLGMAASWESRLAADPFATARLASRRHHLTAVALRQLGRGHESASHERQASLALTLLPDDELLTLRLAVALGRAEDAVAVGRHDEAVEWHARASELARRLDDRAAELAAVSALASDLAALGRTDDALRHHRRALDLARSLGDATATAAVARQALDLLETAAPDDARRRPFEAALAEAAAR